MKTITYQGRELRVADYVTWVAQDGCGELWGHETKPYLVEVYTSWVSSGGKGSRITLNFDSAIPWQDSLERVVPEEEEEEGYTLEFGTKVRKVDGDNELYVITDVGFNYKGQVVVCIVGRGTGLGEYVLPGVLEGC